MLTKNSTCPNHSTMNRLHFRSPRISQTSPTPRNTQRLQSSPRNIVVGQRGVHIFPVVGRVAGVPRSRATFTPVCNYIAQVLRVSSLAARLTGPFTISSRDVSLVPLRVVIRNVSKFPAGQIVNPAEKRAPIDCRSQRATKRL